MSSLGFWPSCPSQIVTETQRWLPPPKSSDEERKECKVIQSIKDNAQGKWDICVYGGKEDALGRAVVVTQISGNMTRANGKSCCTHN